MGPVTQYYLLNQDSSITKITYYLYRYILGNALPAVYWIRTCGGVEGRELITNHIVTH